MIPGSAPGTSSLALARAPAPRGRLEAPGGGTAALQHVTRLETGDERGEEAFSISTYRLYRLYR